MAFTKYQLILITTLVVFGSLNTIAVKWTDYIHSDGRDGKRRSFTHPFLQAAFMFLGEMLCLATFYIIYLMLKSKYDGSEDDNELTKGSRDFNRLILLPPAAMDVCATSLMYLGLAMTNASSFQMLRGSVIVFVALLSLIVLKRKILIREWIGIGFIIVALVIVGVSDIIATDGGSNGGNKEMTTVAPAAASGGEGGVTSGPVTSAPVTTQKPTPARLEMDPENEENSSNEIMKPEDFPDTLDDESHSNDTKSTKEPEDADGGDEKNPLVGDFIIIFAQVITACQMVYEEVFVVKLDIPPLEMVGFEGVFGLAITSVLLIPLNFIPTISALKNSNAGGTLEDSPDAFTQIGNNALLILPILGLMLSIAFYNFAGISLTKEINATTRMVLDSIRMIVVWAFALSVGWQAFHWLQIVGFIFLMTGMCVYNNIIVGRVMEKIRGY